MLALVLNMADELSGALSPRWSSFHGTCVGGHASWSSMMTYDENALLLVHPCDMQPLHSKGTAPAHAGR